LKLGDAISILNAANDSGLAFMPACTDLLTACRMMMLHVGSMLEEDSLIVADSIIVEQKELSPLTVRNALSRWESPIPFAAASAASTPCSSTSSQVRPDSHSKPSRHASAANV
jgi:hypothetical protein